MHFLVPLGSASRLEKPPHTPLVFWLHQPKHQNSRGGRPARHLVSFYYKSEEQTGLGKGSGCFKTPLPPWLGLAISPFSLWNGGEWGAGQRPTPTLRGACTNLGKSGSRDETFATMGDAAVPAQPLPLNRWAAFENWEKEQFGFVYPSAVLPSEPCCSSRCTLPTPRIHHLSCCLASAASATSNCT